MRGCVGRNVVQLLSHALLFCNATDYSLPGSSVHEISQARILEWVAISFPRRSSQARDSTHWQADSLPLIHQGGPISGGKRLMGKQQNWENIFLTAKGEKKTKQNHREIWCSLQNSFSYSGIISLSHLEASLVLKNM